MCTRSIRCRFDGSSIKYNMNAFAVGCWIPNRWYEQQALACVKSIRLAGHEEDVYILTVDSGLAGRIGERDWKVLTFPEISYKGMGEFGVGGKLLRADAQKLYFWAIPDKYQKVIGLDCDVILTRNCEKVFEKPINSFFDHKAHNIPLCSGHFVYQPNYETFRGLLHLVGKGFSKESGWNNHGPFEWKERVWPLWNYWAVTTSQGYLFYYFNFVEKNFNLTSDFMSYWNHYWGDGHRDNSELYKADINRLISCL